jgi:predicted permease
MASRFAVFDSLRVVASRIRGIFTRRRIDEDFQQELDSHLALLTEENMRRGMTPEEARRAAQVRLGGVTQLRETSRELWGLPRVETILQDIRYGMRMLRKNPGFTAVAVFTLAIGIAVNTAVFTAFDATLRPVQATDPGRVVAISRSTLQDPNVSAFSYPDYLYYRDHNTVFSDLFAASETEVALSDTPGAGERSTAVGGITAAIGIRFFQQMAGTAEIGRAATVSDNYFSALGISPVIGRSFANDEPYPVVMLSGNFWARRFGSDVSLLGKPLKLNGKQFTVIGITPKDFIGTYQNAPSVWLPISAYPLLEPGRDPLHSSNDNCCGIFGRLKADVSSQQAQADLTVLADQLRRTYPTGSKSNRPVTISLAPASPFGGHPSPEAIAIVISLMSAVALVLLIACANVAGLQLARSAARQKEIGVRLALGASRGRLVQQLLTEASILAVMAGAAGLVASWFAERFLERSVAAALPPEWGFLAINVSPDIRVFGYALTVSLVTGIMFGLTPALEASKSDVISVLKEEGASFAGKLRGLRLRHFFVAAQIAICLCLLVAAGLLARGSARAVRLNPGFETKHILGLDIEAPLGFAHDAPKKGTVVRQMVERFQTVPGVKEVAMGRVPLAGGLRTASVSLDASSKQSNTPAPSFYYSYVTSNYFDTLSIPLVRGRTFSEAETRAGAPVTVVSEATARKLWAGQEPVGKRVTLDASKEFHGADEPFPSGQSFQVIGVSKDIRSAWLNEIDPGQFYFPLPPDREGDVMVRAESDPGALITTLGEQVKAVDPDVVAYAETLDGLITMNPGFIFSRVGAVFSAIIGLLGLLLASVGVYGMVSYAVVQRTHEVGVRMALGARQSDVLTLILRQSAKPVGVGILAGFVLSVLASRLLSSLLFGVSTLDPLAFGGVSLFLMSVALLACYVPARRATKFDPMVALRYE